MKSIGLRARVASVTRHLVAFAVAVIGLGLPAMAETSVPAAQRASIRVVADDNYPPFLFRDEDGRAQGYLQDYWKLWEKKTGVQVFFRPMQWSKAQEAIQAGEADVIDTIFETEPRKRIYDFTKPYADLPVNIYTNKTIGGITDTETLQGFLVGVMAGDACIDHLAELGLTYLQTYSSYKNLILGAARGEVKVFCLDEEPANYYFYKLNVGSEFRKAFQLYLGQFHRAVRKGDAATLQLVQRGMDLITPEEDAALREKWFGRPIGLIAYSRPFGIVLAMLAALGGALILWNVMLRNSVRARTADLQKALADVRAAKQEADEYRKTLETRVADRTSELTRMALSLRVTNDELHAVFDAAPIGIILARDKVIQNCNSTMEQMFGYQSDELIGKTSRVLFADDATYQENCRKLELGLAEQGSYRDESELFRKDGTSFWCRKMVQMISRTLPEEGYAVTFEDISREQEAIREIERARRLAEDAASAKATFLANMSHEIRTPMNAIIGMTHLALKAGPSERVLDYLKKIERSSKHLLGIINDILDFSKVEAGRMAIESTSFDLAVVIGNVAGLIADGASEKGLKLTVDLPPDVPTALVGDPLRISQILINYLNNAIKFTDAGEIAILVRSEAEEDGKVRLRFSVRDTGIGLSEDQQARLFQSFQQADASTTRKFGGTGLGLAISKRLAELMGGEVGVESVEGKGSTFWFSIPLGKSDGPVADAAELTRPMAGHVLVVDDDEAAREVERTMLEDLGCTAKSVASGAEALAELRRCSDTGHAYDLVLLDWKMPGMDGVAVARKVREMPLQKLPIVLMVTAYDPQDLQHSARALGDVDILPKPVTAATLSKMLSRLMPAGGGTAIGLPPRASEVRRSAEDIRGARALLVEDNDLNQEVAREMLKELGLVVDVAGNGAVAIDMLKSRDYDVVLMDVQMPVLDGIEATVQIRRDPRFKSLPIIAMTASVTQSDQQRCLDCGMNDHVGKPIEPDNLLKTLLKWVKPVPGVRSKQAAGPAAPPPAASSEGIAGVDMASLANIAGLDSAQGLRRVGGKIALYVSLLGKFASGQAQAPADIAAALAAGDRELALRLAHTLKGVAGNIGAERVMSAAAALEAAIHENKGSDEITRLLASVRASLDGVIPALRALGKPAARVAGGVVDERKLAAVCARLTDCLSHSEAEASEVLADNVDLLATAFPADFPAIEQHVRAFDFEAALSALEKARTSRAA